MRKIIICLLFLTALSSCSDWLSVKPKTEIETDVMFETEQGFKDALIGCYALLSSRDLYGGELTCTFLDVLGQQYLLQGTTQNRYYYASRYDYNYSSNEAIIRKIWEQMYKTIANVNAVMEALEKNKGKITPMYYHYMKAEVYSLRAFIYLDLVRLFTWGNLPDHPEKLNKYTLPYPKEYKKDIMPQLQLKEVLSNIHSDIDSGLQIFQQYDPASVGSDRPEDYVKPSDEDAFMTSTQRRYRMNIKAALATRMRLNMWEGNYKKALEDAQLLIDSYNPSWISGLDAGNKNTMDLTFSTEGLFVIETYERFKNIYQNCFQVINPGSETANNNALCLSNNQVMELYETTGCGISDWRYTTCLQGDQSNWQILKFWEDEDKMSYKDNMPLIKWPEIYYTAAECLLRAGGTENKQKAISYLNTVRSHRNIHPDWNLSNNLSEEEVKNEIYKEWRKEMIGDGQMFYYYKRNGYTTIPDGPSLVYDDKVYVLPIPQDEIDFGGRTELFL